MSFIDARLLEKVAYGFTTNPTFETLKTPIISGRVRRNAERSLPLYRFNAPFQNINPEDFDLLYTQYLAAVGGLHSFRFTDPIDNQLDDVIIGVSDGSTNEQMQIVKPFAFGAESVNRLITKPVNSAVYVGDTTLVVTADNVPISPGIDYLTGILTLNAAAAEVIRVTCAFDVPVIFNEDVMDGDYTTWRALNVDIELMEDFSA